MGAERRTAATRRKPFAISCTPLEWETIRERARRADLSISAFVRERLQTVATGRSSQGTPHAVAAPSDSEWRDLLHDAERVVEGLGIRSADTTPGVSMGDALIALVHARMAEMVRWGRERQLHQLLCEVVGERRAESILHAVARQPAPGIHSHAGGRRQVRPHEG